MNLILMISWVLIGIPIHLSLRYCLYFLLEIIPSLFCFPLELLLNLGGICRADILGVRKRIIYCHVRFTSVRHLKGNSHTEDKQTTCYREVLNLKVEIRNTLLMQSI